MCQKMNNPEQLMNGFPKNLLEMSSEYHQASYYDTKLERGIKQFLSLHL
jgi:hypothetical protein